MIVSAVQSLPTSYPLLYSVENSFLIFFVAYWSRYEVGRLRTAVATFKNEDIGELEMFFVFLRFGFNRSY